MRWRRLNGHQPFSSVMRIDGEQPHIGANVQDHKIRLVLQTPVINAVTVNLTNDKLCKALWIVEVVGHRGVTV